MTNYIEPFNFKKILVDYLLGSTELFMFAAIIIYSYAAAKYQMSNILYLTILSVIGIVFASYMGQSVYVLIIFLIGLFSFKGFGKIVT